MNGVRSQTNLVTKTQKRMNNEIKKNTEISDDIADQLFGKTGKNRIVIDDPNIPFKTWKEALFYGKENFVGKYWNQSAHEYINVSVERIRKILGESVTNASISEQLHLKAFYQLRFIVENGELYERRPCDKGDANVKEMQEFKVPLELDGDNYIVFFLVKAFKAEHEGNNLHHYEVQNEIQSVRIRRSQ